MERKKYRQTNSKRKKPRRKKIQMEKFRSENFNLNLMLKFGETFFLCEVTGVEKVFSVLSGGESED